jgi:hypothetical protein
VSARGKAPGLLAPNRRLTRVAVALVVVPDTSWEWLVNASRTALATRLRSNQEQLNARNDSCLPIITSFQKVVNKLSTRNWLLIYDCIKTEFALQAEALRR